jgi:glycine dehydrogenase subunit 1
MSYVPATTAEIDEMLATIGVGSIDDLFDCIPEDMRVQSWDIPPGISEMAVRKLMAEIAGKNDVSLVSFLGGGYYDHYIPAAVDEISSRSEFLTPYTPYQAECAQGTLQSIYEYQSAVCRLTEMDIANASLDDGGTALFEAATMSVRLTGRTKVVCHPSVNPIHLDMLKAHAGNTTLIEIDYGESPSQAACMIVQNPGFLGTIRDFSGLADRCHEDGTLLAQSFHPLSLGLLKSPGEIGADIAVADGQSLGLPLAFGGPYLGIMAVRKRHMRKMPGRIAAATQDGQGKRGFVLTLQAREQHIRRERAVSNICSNEAQCALRALVYLCLLGKQGLRDVAVCCHSKTEYLKSRLSFAEILNDGPTFNEFAVRLPRDASKVAEAMLAQGFCAGLPLADVGAGESGDLLVAVTEKRTKEELDEFARALEDAACN